MAEVVLFVIQTFFEMYLMVVVARLVMQYVRVSFLNPIAHFSYAMTEPPLRSLRRFLPTTPRIDLPLLVYLILLIWLELVLVGLLDNRGVPSVIGLIMASCSTLVHLGVTLYVYAIIAVILLSWTSPGMQTPVTSLLTQLTEPVLNPVRRVLPSVGGFDLSPVVAIVGLKALEMVVGLVIMSAGVGLSMVWSGLRSAL